MPLAFAPKSNLKTEKMKLVTRVKVKDFIPEPLKFRRSGLARFWHFQIGEILRAMAIQKPGIPEHQTSFCSTVTVTEMTEYRCSSSNITVRFATFIQFWPNCEGNYLYNHASGSTFSSRSHGMRTLGGLFRSVPKIKQSNVIIPLHLIQKAVPKKTVWSIFHEKVQRLSKLKTLYLSP